ncbi:MotE family protein [Methylobrevis albus]|uniref:Flagellar protein FlbB n=1 Tax=Methylobrevis albus TaxID=2793297 RepID=A0A931MYA8_9HYPH|nr:flagellar protein FlbB [Methylobrevis albus]MBH0236874.1 flagellar protein FlbB [Methylobrevis albus]
MKDIRLLPIVLVAVSGLLMLKLLGFATGEAVVPLGPMPAFANEDAAAPAEAEGEAPAAADEPAAESDAAAAEEKPSAEGEPAADAGATTTATGMPVSTTRPEEVRFETPTSEDALLKRLAERRMELDKREQEIELRARLLEAAESRIGERVEELKALETKIGVAAEVKKADEVQQLKGLVTMYENMKPKDAARVFDKLGFEVLLPLVEQVNPRKMSAILANMNPEAAGRLTAAIARKNASRPEVVAETAPPAPAPAAMPVDQLPKIGPAGG